MNKLGEVTGAIRLTLRLEGLFVLIACLLAYLKLDFEWSTFAIFFLAPDLALFGYLAGPRIGAFAYNLSHSYIGAIVSVVTGVMLSLPPLLMVGVIWCAHIGFDRALGYGLKYSSGFGVTHLGRIGRFSKTVM